MYILYLGPEVCFYLLVGKAIPFFDDLKGRIAIYYLVLPSTRYVGGTST